MIPMQTFFDVYNCILGWSMCECEIVNKIMKFLIVGFLSGVHKMNAGMAAQHLIGVSQSNPKENRRLPAQKHFVEIF